MQQNIAIVGCGAITQNFYLPALAERRREFGSLWLVDQAKVVLANSSPPIVANIASSLSEVRDDLHYVIVALPNELHFSVAKEALSRGAHVLVEKPFVIWPGDGRELVDLAKESKRILAVNQMRRFFPYTLALRELIATGALGELLRVEHCEGAKLAWPIQSGAAFRQGAQRTGIIMDIGVHVLDFYQFLFDPLWSIDASIHDGFNGPEGLARIDLRANSAPVQIRLSHYQPQTNKALLTFENGDVELNVYEMNRFRVSGRAGAGWRKQTGPAVVDFEYLGAKVLSNFVGAARGSEACMSDASSSLPVIELLDHIYKRSECYPTALGSI